MDGSRDVNTGRTRNQATIQPLKEKEPFGSDSGMGPGADPAPNSGSADGSHDGCASGTPAINIQTGQTTKQSKLLQVDGSFRAGRGRDRSRGGGRGRGRGRGRGGRDGPSALLSPAARRLAARDPMHGLPNEPPVEHTMPVKTAAQEMATCTTTHYTLEIVARSGVAVEGDLDEEVRALKSPSSNFIWDGASVVGTTTETWSGEETLRIVLLHNGDNHNGNVCQATINAFRPTVYDQRDLMQEKEEVIGLDQIIAEIRSWKTKVQSCVVVAEKPFTQLASGIKGIGYPNGMGNPGRYPAPWDSHWEACLAMRLAKKRRYETELAAAEERQREIKRLSRKRRYETDLAAAEERQREVKRHQPGPVQTQRGGKVCLDSARDSYGDDRDDGDFHGEAFDGEESDDEDAGSQGFDASDEEHDEDPEDAYEDEDDGEKDYEGEDDFDLSDAA